ncbi:HNH endonuclease [Candidatus Kaiserbacteria bacterium]|nr:HNH endonuclease [Candidatus Kaiserbacteria bacterium]
MSNCTSKITKVCTKCNVEKPLSEFHKSKSGKYGVRGECKPCALEYRRQYRKNNRKEIAEYQHQWREKNRKEIAENGRQYYEKNSEQCRERVRQWQQANPEKARAHWRNRRARKHNAGGTHTVKDINLLYAGQAGKCWYCGVNVGNEFHVDHFIPLAEGGSNDVGNLRISCPACNLSKGAKDPHEWSGRLL